MSDNDVQKKLGQHKKSRVYIHYKPQAGMGEQVELPLVVGVMANLSGHKSAEDRGEILKRKFEFVQGGNLDPLMKKVRPELRLTVANKLSGAEVKDSENLSVSLKFAKLSDFEPKGIAEQVPELKELMEIRTKLANLKAYLDGKPGAQKFISAELRKLMSGFGREK